MNSEQVPPGTAVDPPAATTTKNKQRKRLVGIDAARGLALIGLMAVHILPETNEVTHAPTLVFSIVNGNSAALFALLAGVGLALSTGGSTPHQGRRMRGDRAGLAVRAALIGFIGLVVAAISPEDPPAYSILVYYAVFFLLTIPFLHLSPRVLFGTAAVFGIVAPVLMQKLEPVLPSTSASNHTLVTLFTEPAGTAAELLLTGVYPALPYMTYLLVGLGLGRLDLRSTRTQAIIAGTGALLALSAQLLSTVLLRVAGGYQALLASDGLSPEELDEALTYSTGELPDTSGWWLTIATGHTNAPLAIASSLGIGLLVLGVFLLLGARAGRWLAPLAAMGAMTLTLYTAHLIALAPEVHYDDPELWFALHLGVAAVAAWFWTRHHDKGPLETVVGRAVKGTRTMVTDGAPGTYPGGTDNTTPDSVSRDITRGSGTDPVAR
ncbi:heparan-alpha-glucosaminide N-acetyltransferase domain-containing protein [Citricoccus sp.]|uniref:heparan-alpha-glucosaminide N-acetyltransferase domain-containing protein n=1 Tax=Citricoccus sp. TaxID=1978372 RepID=UPI002622CE9C|nr:heparan-alpha-glucosaminide N-acetyltransferase domain-containing protein [Citricoccus sp.]HRO93998.1 heparan-alpha-glucosaminide N-acetyltransferase domain-containing protein [Citricoccus sp.]